MNHEHEIWFQRLKNSQEAMKTARENLVVIQNKIKANWKAEEVMNDIDEIIGFLNWAIQQ